MNNLSLKQGWVMLWYLLLGVLCLTHSPTFANNVAISQTQQQIITGTVTDVSGALPSVTVTVKGTTNATLSNENGHYSIRVNNGDILVFSFIGFKTVEISVSDQTIIDVVLEEDATLIEDVTINAGYYTVKDRERTGSIARVTSKDIESQQSVTNVLGTMQGRVAGVNIVQESGIAGGGFSINIRGINSLREDANAPLYIIDGVPYSSDPISDRQTSTSIPGDGNPLASINPTDIESVEILKDADATAIYGSRGANGVVLITTKKGKKGKTTFTLDSNYSFGSVTKMMDLMNTEQYLAMRRKAFENDGITDYPFNAYDVNGTWNQNRYTDWQKVLIGGTSEIKGYQATVSGGTEQTSFLISGNYRNETSVFPGDFEYKKGGGRINFDHSSKDNKFRINFSGSYIAQNNHLPWIDFVTLSRQLAPNAPALYDAEGNLNWENNTWENPLANLESKNKAKTADLIANAVISYQLTKDLEAKANFGFTDMTNDDSRSIPSTMYNPAYNLSSQYSSIYINNFKRHSWIVEPQLNWKKDLKNSALNLLVGATYQNQQSSRLVNLASGFPSNSLLYDLASASEVYTLSNNQIQYKYQAFFGRANYILADKYIFNLTGRRDGSSRFGQGKQFATFGALGVAWLFHRESLIEQNINFLNFGKLRASYGTTGSDKIGDYQFLDTYTSSGIQYGGNNGLQPSRLYNPDFSWETNKKIEASLELGFFDDQIFLTTSWYKNRSSNQLVGYALPSTTGFTSIQANLDAVVENTGFELVLRTVNIKNKDFSWITNFNITKAGNKLVSFPGLENSIYRNQFVIGQPTTIQKLFHFTGVDPQTGLYQFEDVNGDGVISYEHDRETIKDFNPEYFGGLHNEFNYKGFQLDFLFQFVKQQNFNFANTQRFAGMMINQPTEYINSWQQAGDIAPYQMYATEYNPQAFQQSEFFALSDGAVSDASFIRLKNISLSYRIPEEILNNVSCRLSLQAQNLFTVTSFKGADPEFTLGGTLPPLRIFSIGLQLTF